MSCNNWEHGSITLPAAAAAPLKKLLREAANKDATAALAEAKAWHAAHRTRSRATYEHALYEKSWSAAASQNTPRYGRANTVPNGTVLSGRAESVLRAMLTMSTNPVTPTRAHADRAGFRIATNRDTRFLVMSREGHLAATISFEGRVVTWSVTENNRAVETADASPLAAVFFGALNKVTWTRGTGGVLVGNDEYNQDTREVGGGRNYITRTFGPKGEQARKAAFGL